MSAPSKAPSPEKTLRKLFLTLFLRGRSSRGLRRETAPKSVGSKLGLILGIYAFIGLMLSLAFLHKPVFGLSLYMHSMTLVFLGMFVAASAGEVLFNKDEADILMHRPVLPRTMLWAKIAVLVQVSLWLAGAFNLSIFFLGMSSASPWWLFPFVHAASSACQALFCTGGVIVVYQLCLRWFGREKMEGLMTTAQVMVGIVAVLIGQVAPQLLQRFDLKLDATTAWWMDLLPPAWFAGIDDALAGTGNPGSWLLAGIGVGSTAFLLWLAFGKLARDYETGLQAMNESAPTPRRRSGRQRRLADVLVNAPPLCWWMRDSVSRASFLLTAAYLTRDRDVKLRIYPGVAPMLVWPLVFLLQEGHPRYHSGAGTEGIFSGYSVAFAGVYLGIIPMMALSLIRYSQQWQAADLFRVAPIHGPAPLCAGARRAILSLLGVPSLLIFAGLAWFLGRGSSHLPLLIPGVIALPVYALVPCIGGGAVPLSLPTEEAKSASRGLSMIGVMIVAAIVAGIATAAWSYGLFKWFLLLEILAAGGIYYGLRVWAAGARWEPID